MPLENHPLRERPQSLQAAVISCLPPPFGAVHFPQKARQAPMEEFFFLRKRSIAPRSGRSTTSCATLSDSDFSEGLTASQPIQRRKV